MTTNAPEGRKYDSFVVPNGTWVLEAPSTWADLVGLSLEEVDYRRYFDNVGGRHGLYIADRPFGYVVIEAGAECRPVFPLGNAKPVIRQTLAVARQIHKGELGRSVPIPPLRYVRQPFEDGQKLGVTKGHQRRRGYGWVKLDDLGEMTVGYRPDKQIELILGYFQFSGHLRYEDLRPVGTLVDVVWGSELEIKAGEVEVLSLTPEKFREMAEEDTSELWVRRGFAYTILRLQALGVEPSVIQTA